VWDLAGLTGFEEVELLAASTLTLPGTPGFRVLGSSARDVITLGGPRQTVFGFAGDDLVAVTAASLVGSVLNGGTETGADTLRLDAAGTYDLRRSGVAGFERLEQLAGTIGVSNILLPNTPFDVVLRHATSLSLGAHAQQSVAGSARNDVIALGAAGQFIDGAGGADTISGSAATLQLGTVVSGGTGDDLLRIAGGTVNLATGALVLDVERITLTGPTDLTLDTTPGLLVTGSAGADTVTAFGIGLHGDLGFGSDLLRIGGIGLFGGVAEPLSGGSGTDRLSLFEDFTGLPLTVSTRFVSFEIIDLYGLVSRQVTLQGTESRVVELGAGPVQVFGSEGAEEFISDGAFNLVSGGGGADTIRQTVSPNSGQALVGNGGDDVIVFAPDTGTATIGMPTAWAAETVRLVGAHNFTANLQSGLRVVGDPTLANVLWLRGDFQRADGGSGPDQLSNIGGLATTLAGGEGPDLYIVDASLPALWTTPGQTILDNSTAFTLNTMRIVGTGTLTIDFADHNVRFVDRIEVFTATAAVRLTLTEQMAQDADSNNGGAAGDFDVVALATMSVGARLDASAFSASSVFRMSGSFNAADTVTGGAGNDVIAAGGGADTVAALAGNDTINGGAGADSLNGGAGNDVIFGDADADIITAGDGVDIVTGGAGGDRIALAEGNPVTDTVRFLDIGDGTVDINDAGSVSQTTADSISGFDASLDKIQLSRSGLGLGTGGVQNVAANGAWNIGTNAVFLFESDSGNSDTLSSNSFASFDAIAFAINTDNGAGSGSSVGRTVALVVSNLESISPRATGVYVWTDTDGDSLLEASDVVRLLGVFHGVTANQMATGAAVVIVG
jgi:Ca2+-binding RTX toxin-like protein